LASSLVFVCSLAAQAPAGSTASPPFDDRLNPVAPADISVARIRFLADNGERLDVDDADGRILPIKVSVSDLKLKLKKPGDQGRRAYAVGDVVRLWIANDGGDLALRHIEPISTRSGPVERVLVLAVAFVVLFVAVSLLYRGDAKALIVGFDGRYSKSKFQMAVWFAALFASYVAAVYLRARYSHGLSWGGVNIPQNLLLISGLSALSFAGAKGITTSAVSRGSVSKPQGTPSFPGDLLYADDHRPDFGDFQMLVVTALATCVFLGSVVTFLGQMDLGATVTLPDVDTTILSAFGLGQGAYLAKKTLGTPAPNSARTTTVD
jgi:hypothetical protein